MRIDMVNGLFIILFIIINFDVLLFIYRFKEESICYVYCIVRVSVFYRKLEVEYIILCKRNFNNKLKIFKRKELK